MAPPNAPRTGGVSRLRSRRSGIRLRHLAAGRPRAEQRGGRRAGTRHHHPTCGRGRCRPAAGARPGGDDGRGCGHPSPATREHHDDRARRRPHVHGPRRLHRGHLRRGRVVDRPRRSAPPSLRPRHRSHPCARPAGRRLPHGRDDRSAGRCVGGGPGRRRHRRGAVGVHVADDVHGGHHCRRAARDGGRRARRGGVVHRGARRRHRAARPTHRPHPGVPRRHRTGLEARRDHRRARRRGVVHQPPRGRSRSARPSAPAR